jgi:hypothetical protein
MKEKDKKLKWGAKLFIAGWKFIKKKTKLTLSIIFCIFAFPLN